jgi:hypothetical protein
MLRDQYAHRDCLSPGLPSMSKSATTLSHKSTHQNPQGGHSQFCLCQADEREHGGDTSLTLENSEIFHEGTAVPSQHQTVLVLVTRRSGLNLIGLRRLQVWLIVV